jgi:hypothetical protein
MATGVHRNRAKKRAIKRVFRFGDIGANFVLPIP